MTAMNHEWTGRTLPLLLCCCSPRCLDTSTRAWTVRGPGLPRVLARQASFHHSRANMLHELHLSHWCAPQLLSPRSTHMKKLIVLYLPSPLPLPLPFPLPPPFPFPHFPFSAFPLFPVLPILNSGTYQMRWGTRFLEPLTYQTVGFHGHLCMGVNPPLLPSASGLTYTPYAIFNMPPIPVEGQGWYAGVLG
jgi:hypothetical protein